MFGEQFGDARLICLRRGGGKGERHIAKPQVEQPIATSRLAVIIALGGGSTEDFDLTVVQPEPPVDGGDLRFDRAFVGQEDARRAAFNDGGCNGRGRSEEHTSELQSLMRISYAVFCLKKKTIILYTKYLHSPQPVLNQ